MRILLVQSYLGGNEPLVVPLGLLCLAGALKEHEVKIFDTNCSDHPFEELKGIVRRFRPDVVGISLRNIDSTNKAQVVFYYKYLGDILDSLAFYSKAAIVVGGSGFSMFAKEIMLREPRIDFGVYLEGETTFAALINNLGMPHKIPCVYFRENEQVRFSGSAQLMDLRKRPGPRWESLNDPKAYTTNKDAFGIETKRGCALGCIYCVYGFLNGKKYRLKDPIDVVNEIQALHKVHGVRRFTFVDSIFNVPLEHARNICKELALRNLPVKWSAFLSERFIDEPLLELLKAAGCDHIILSPDGYTDSVLKGLGKNIDRRHIKRAYGLLSRNGNFEVSYNFFKNPPGQTLSNFMGMLLFCIRAKLKLKKKVHFEFSVLRIEPHTRLREIAINEGVLDSGQCLLEPFYYKNKKTAYLELLFDNLILFWKNRRQI